MKVFLSYSRGDQHLADRMADSLEQRGFDVLIDRRDLPYGERWQVELANLIRTADTVVWLVSQRSVHSKWCRWELGETQRLSKRLVPVAIEPISAMDLPEALGAIQLLPREGVFDEHEHLQLLVDTLHTDQGWLRVHTQLADRARQWEVSNKSSSHLLRGIALSDAQAWLDRRRPTTPPPSAEILALILSSRRAGARRWLWLMSAPFLLIATGLFAYAAVMWSRVTPLPDSNLQSGDMETADGLIGFESSLAWCRMSCLYGQGNPKCVAFSWDERTKKCYPKVEVGFYSRPSLAGQNPTYSEIMPGIDIPSGTTFVTAWDLRLFGKQIVLEEALARKLPLLDDSFVFIKTGSMGISYWQMNAIQCQRACNSLGNTCRGFNYSRLKCQLMESIGGFVQDPTTNAPSFHPGLIAACRDPADCKLP